jgi:competence protein ComEA
MGVYDRDYMREPQRRPLWRWPVVICLTAMFAAGMIVGLGRTEMLRRGPRAPRPERRDSHESRELREPREALVTIVNVNTASREELDELPYVSPNVAQAILRGRPYKSVDDLIRVRGIGPKTLERIRPYVKVE